MHSDFVSDQSGRFVLFLCLSLPLILTSSPVVVGSSNLGFSLCNLTICWMVFFAFHCIFSILQKHTLTAYILICIWLFGHILHTYIRISVCSTDGLFVESAMQYVLLKSPGGWSCVVSETSTRKVVGCSNQEHCSPVKAPAGTAGGDVDGIQDRCWDLPEPCLWNKGGCWEMQGGSGSLLTFSHSLSACLH